MCEIDITAFCLNANPFEFSASRAERGDNAGPETWRNALAEAERAPLLSTEEHLEAMRRFVRESGGWNDREVAAMSAQELNALLVQWISGDLREADYDESFPDEFDWSDYEERCRRGECLGRFYRADDGRIFYSLS